VVRIKIELGEHSVLDQFSAFRFALNQVKRHVSQFHVCKIMDCFNHLDQSSFLEKFMVLDLPWSVSK